MPRNPDICCTSVALAEEDVLAAMRSMHGYIDISPDDFREIYQIAHAHALSRLQRSLIATDLMTRPVECLLAEWDLHRAATLLAAKGYSGAPVTNEAGRIVGVLSEKDFLSRMGVGTPASFLGIIAHCLANQGCLAVSLRNHTVAEIMSAPPITAGPDIAVSAISTLFIDHRINRLPIVDRERRLLGIVTRTDIVQSCCITL